MTTVILAEKPSQAKAYAEAFKKSIRKDGFYEVSDPLFNGTAIITYGFGHLVELSDPSIYNEDWKNWSLDNLPIFPEKFTYTIPKDKKKQFSIVKKHLQSADTIVIATDSDREGELIAWSIINQSGVTSNTVMKRLWINSLEKDVIYKGFKELRPASETYSKFEEAQARQQADWLVGLNGSRLYSLLLQSKGITESFPLGRVQTPTLYMIYQLQEKIKHFKKEPYVEGLGEVKASGGVFKAKFSPNVPHKDRDSFESFLNTQFVKIGDQPGKISKVETVQKNTPSPRLFSLSALQSKMNAQMKASASDTLAAIQSLYDKKYLSYPRTDTPYITKNEQKYLVTHLNDYLSFLNISDATINTTDPNTRYVNDKKVQEHHAIIPTKQVMSQACYQSLSPLEQALYSIVLRTTVAMFLPKYTFNETIILTNVSELTLKTIGKTPVNKGWKQLFDTEDDTKTKSQTLPQVIEGEIVTVNISGIDKETQPPNSYTEGTLITAMKTAGKTVDDEEAQSILKEVEGIGTEATRASIIETLKKTGYILVEKNKLVVTAKGQLLCQAVESEPLLTSAEMTAKWEAYLKKIGQKTGNKDSFVNNIQKFILHLLEVVPGQIEQTDLSQNLKIVTDEQLKKKEKEILGTCPKCQKANVKKHLKVAACSNEGCDFKVWLTVANKKLSTVQLKQLIKNKRTSSLVKGLKGKKGTFDAYIILKDDYSTAFEFKK